MSGSKQISLNQAEPCTVQRVIEKVLGTCVVILALCHMLSALGRYLIDFYTIVRPYECWFALGLLIAWVVYLLLYLIFWRKTLYRVGNFFKKLLSPAQIFCFLLVVWYVVSCWVNENGYQLPLFMYNDWWILDAAINCIILFNLPFILPVEKAKKVVEMMLHVVSLFGTVVASYSLWCLFTLNVVTVPSGEQIGMMVQRKHIFFNLACYYNITGAIALTLILICFYMLASQKWFIKILYGTSLLIHTLILLLSNSRASFGACVLAYVIFLFLVIWNQFSQNKVWIRLAGGIAASAVAGALLWMSRTWAFQLFELVTDFSEKLASKTELMSPTGSVENLFVPQSAFLLFSLKSLLPKGKTTGKSARNNISIIRIMAIFAITLVIWAACVFPAAPFLPDQQVQRTRVVYADGENKAADAAEEAVRSLTDNLETFSSRVSIWEAAIKVMKSSKYCFIFGVTPVSVANALNQIGGYRTIPAHAHNEILQMGVSLGVPMMVLYVIFLVVTAIKSLRLAFSAGRKRFQGAYMIPVVFVTLTALTLLEAYLFGYYSIMSSVYFLFCGWIHALSGKKNEENIL